MLEHAIDSILEAGEIPHRSLFTEIICQAVSQQNFKRTVALINGLAYASMQVSESQWLDIFHTNKDQLDKEILQNLLNYLDDSSNLVMEDPVPNFIRSVKSYVRLPSINTPVLSASGDDSDEGSVFHESARGVKHREWIQGHLPSNDTLSDSDGRLQPKVDYFTPENSNCDAKSSTRQLTDMHLPERVDCDEVSSSTTGNEGKQPGSIQKGNSNSLIGESSFDLLADDVDSSFSKLPSASDILDTWKKDRIKDDIFPFEYISSNSH